MIDSSLLIKHYSRKDVQEELVKAAKDREVAFRFGDKGFGKRPDTLSYPADVLELAKQGVTSFHCSEELWHNPLNISTDLKPNEVRELRKGWDLVIDVDCKDWDYAKTVSSLIIKALKKHNVSSITAKFSGSKGFHIGVPFEAFPEKTLSVGETKDKFPEGVKIIAEYLMHYIDSKENNFELSKALLKDPTYIIARKVGLEEKDIAKEVCSRCGTEKTAKQVKPISCIYCHTKNPVADKNYFTCTKCRKLVRFDPPENTCVKCRNKKFISKIDLTKVINIDTLLISSRHLFRMPYSFHEKSGLVSVPVDIDNILNFDKTLAKPSNIIVGKYPFLSRDIIKNNAKDLFDAAFQWNSSRKENKPKQEYRETEVLAEALPEEYFPPCISRILEGIEDGKKRALFILTNFLKSVGWSSQQIEERLREWNKKNPEPLRENYLQGQLSYHKRSKKAVLPPNCDNSMYYKDLQICLQEALCPRIKNPVQYSKRKVRYRKTK